MSKFILKLYITGQTANSERAVTNLRRLCEMHLNNECDLDIIDVLERPELAERDRIFATPTLVKESPRPARRIIGDLTETKKVLDGLDLAHMARPDGN